MSMRIAIIGAGGVGGFLAHRLVRAGTEVAILARGAHLAAIRAEGLTLADDHAGEETVRPALATDRGEARERIDALLDEECEFVVEPVS